MTRIAGIECGTHCYVGQLTCGCGVAIVRDMPGFKKDTAKEVARMIRDGYSVTHLPNESADAAFHQRCANYPHEPWQLRLEQK